MRENNQRFINVLKNEKFKIISQEEWLGELRIRVTALEGKNKRVFDIFYDDGRRARIIEIFSRLKTTSSIEFARKLDSCCIKNDDRILYPFTTWLVNKGEYLAFQYSTSVEGLSPSSAVYKLFNEYNSRIVNRRESLYKEIFAYIKDHNLFYYPQDIFKIDFL